MCAIFHRGYVDFLIICILTFLTLFWILTEMKYSWEDLHFHKLFKSTEEQLKNNNIWHSKNNALILDTPGCKIPKFDPYDRTVLDFFTNQPPHICPGKPLFLLTHPNGSITINETTLTIFYNLTQQEVACVYQGIRRKREKPGKTSENNFKLGKSTDLTFGKPLNEDHVVVLCDLGDDVNLTQFIPIPRIVKKVEDKRSAKEPFVPRLNVIMVGIDSVSKLNFLRHFRKTRKFLERKMSPLDMKGYMKVGDDTFPNLICLLSGHLPQEVWNETLKDTMFLDDVDLIWKRYADKGYRTLFAEDLPLAGAFNHGKRGFNDPPTDYYFRPLSLAIRQSELHANSKDSCLNSQTESDIIFDYVKDFILAMGPRPYFAFAMISSLTHYYINNAAKADRPAVRLLENLWNIGALNNSVLVFFSDHGLRFGGIRRTYIGKIEERMPFMYLHFPQWFLSQYPQYNANLLKNQERLVTVFDVHATLLHLLEPTHELSKEFNAYGTSLLNEISPYRTCEKASVMAPWCVCQILHDESINEPTVIKAATAIVHFINERLVPRNSTCPRLEVGTITKARYGQVSDSVLMFVKHENVVVNRHVVFDKKIETYVDYVVSLTTKPGNAALEGTVRLDKENNIYDVLFIKRTNPNASNCIKDEQLKTTCYCI